MEGNLIINSKFQPFSFQEMLAPMAMYTQEYNAQEAGFSELNTKSNLLDKYVNEQNAPKAYSAYKTYNQDLMSGVDTLSKQGLTPGSRQALLNMKNRYSSEIAPIEQAIVVRNQIGEEQNKSYLQDPTLRFARKAGQLSLDDLIANPNYRPESYSGALLAKQVASEASNMVRSDRTGKWEKILGNEYFERVKQNGFTPEEVDVAMKNPEAQPLLSGIVNNALEASGVNKWADEPTKKEFLDYANSGLYSAIGGTDSKVLENKAWDYAMREAAAKRQFRREHPEVAHTPYAATNTYFDVSTQGKTLANLVPKLNYGSDGKMNPLSQYVVDKKYNEILKKRYDEGVKSLSKDATGLLKLRELYKNTIGSQRQLPFTEDEYNALKEAGLNAKMSAKDFQNKLYDYQDKQSKAYTGYSLNLTDYSYIESRLAQNFNNTNTNNKGTQIITKLDDNFKPIDGTGSRSGRWLRSDAFTFEGDIKGKIADIQYVPKARGLVLITTDGNRFLINKGAITDQLDPASETKFNDKVNNLIKEGDYQGATDLIQGVVSAIVPQLTHSQNPVQSKTSPYPFGEKP